jgi:hypothetical protein
MANVSQESGQSVRVFGYASALPENIPENAIVNIVTRLVFFELYFSEFLLSVFGNQKIM